MTGRWSTITPTMGASPGEERDLFLTGLDFSLPVDPVSTLTLD